MRTRKLSGFVLTVALGLGFASAGICGGGPPELYSWKEGNEWRFSVLAGTNRYKSVREVKEQSKKMNLEQLLKRIAELKSGEELLWSQGRGVGKPSSKEFAMPPAEVVSQIKSKSKERNVKLVSFEASVEK